MLVHLGNINNFACCWSGFSFHNEFFGISRQAINLFPLFICVCAGHLVYYIKHPFFVVQFFQMIQILYFSFLMLSSSFHFGSIEMHIKIKQKEKIRARKGNLLLKNQCQVLEIPYIKQHKTIQCCCLLCFYFSKCYFINAFVSAKSCKKI